MKFAKARWRFHTEISSSEQPVICTVLAQSLQNSPPSFEISRQHRNLAGQRQVWRLIWQLIWREVVVFFEVIAIDLLGNSLSHDQSLPSGSADEDHRAIARSVDQCGNRQFLRGQLEAMRIRLRLFVLVKQSIEMPFSDMSGRVTGLSQYLGDRNFSCSQMHRRVKRNGSTNSGSHWCPSSYRAAPSVAATSPPRAAFA